MISFDGIFTPVITPFHKNYDINYKSFEKILEFLIKNKVHGIVIGGTTGEYYAQTIEERVSVLKFAKDVVKNKVHLMAGVTALTSKDSLYLASVAKQLKYNSLLVGTPPYSQPTQTESANHFIAIHQSSKLPIMMYNFPAKMGFEIGPDFLQKVMKYKNFLSIKHNSSDPSMIRYFAEHYPQLQISCGADLQVLEYYSWGAKSWVGGCSNFIPKQHISVFNNAIHKKNFDSARKDLLKIMPTINFINSIGKYNQSVKVAMNELGFNVGTTRLPSQPLTNVEQKLFKKYLQSIL